MRQKLKKKTGKIREQKAVAKSCVFISHNCNCGEAHLLYLLTYITLQGYPKARLEKDWKTFQSDSGIACYIDLVKASNL